MCGLIINPMGASWLGKIVFAKPLLEKAELAPGARRAYYEALLDTLLDRILPIIIADCTDFSRSILAALEANR